MSFDLNEYVRDKTVCIVGGASSVTPGFLKADRVVRTNNHWIRQQGPCHVLFHGCCVEPLHIGLYPSTTYFCFNRLATFSMTMVRHVRCLDVPSEAYWLFPALNDSGSIKTRWLHDFMQRFQLYPFTGFVALARMLASPAKEIRLTGMDLFDGTDTNALGTHSVEAHREALQILTYEDERIILDTTLAARLCPTEKAA